MKASFWEDGYAKEADGAGKVLGVSSAEGDGEGVGRGKGCCTESEGRDNLVSKLEEHWRFQSIGLPQNLQRNRMRFLHSIDS